MTLQDKNHFIAIFRTHTRILNCVIILTNNQIAVFKNDWEGKVGEAEENDKKILGLTFKPSFQQFAQENPIG